MGELLNIAAERGIESLRQLAVQLLERQPHGSKAIGLEGLANKVRDLDKGKDLAWWSKAGKRYQTPLAEVLGVEFDELLALLERGDSSLLRRWRFDQLEIRPLDLEHEALFPGIPPEISQPRGPDAKLTWWLAPPGAGKSVVGRWLAIRHGWTVFSASSWKELEERLPANGDVFVELESGRVPNTGRALAERKGRLCVACPMRPAPPVEDERASDQPLPGAPRDRDRAGLEWKVVVTPPAASWFIPLIDWVADRIADGGGFRRAEVQALMAQFSWEGTLATPGELLGFLGVVDRIGVTELRKLLEASGEQTTLVRAWWKVLCDRKDREEALKKTDLKKRGVELLCRAEERRLQRLLPARLPPEGWTELLGEQPSAPIDCDELIEILKLPDGKERALRRLNAAGKEAMSGFRTIGVLHEREDGRLAILPSWIATLLNAVAVGHLAEEPSTLGALLLHPETAARVLRTMWSEVQDGQLERVQRCLRPVSEPPSAEELAVVNGAFLAVGLAVAANTAVPIEVVRAAWRRQAPYLASRYQNLPIPTPMLAATASREGRGLTSRTTWILAAVAIVNRLAEEAPLAEAIAEPWSALLGEGPPPPSSPGHLLLRSALDDAAHALGPDDDEALLQLPYLLGERLLPRHGFVAGSHGLVVRGQQPARLVRLRDGSVEGSEEEREELLRLPWGLKVLEQSCQRLGTPCDDVLRWCWKTWGQSQRRRGDWPPSNAHAPASMLKRLWQLAPATALSDDAFRGLEVAPAAWPVISEEVWKRWILLFQPHSERHLRMLEHLPSPLAVELLRSGRISASDHQAREQLWARIPAELLVLISELAAVPPSASSPLPALVFSTPEPYVEQLLARAEQWRAAPASYPGVTDWLGRWLLHVIERRLPGWRCALTMALAASGNTSLTVPLA